MQVSSYLKAQEPYQAPACAERSGLSGGAVAGVALGVAAAAAVVAVGEQRAHSGARRRSALTARAVAVSVLRRKGQRGSGEPLIESDGTL
jgi:hypothetical protein